jgi:hypothetical protein
MDYLDNPLPGSIPAGADSRAAKKVRISTGVHIRRHAPRVAEIHGASPLCVR